MNFTKYNGIDNLSRKQTVDYIVAQGFSEGEWVVENKIHGCVDGDQLIETLEHGKLPIRDIVDKQLPCRVKSFNTDTQEIEFRSVTNYSSKENLDTWFEIELEDGKTMVLTSEHKVYLPERKCYRAVKDLEEGDVCLVD